MRWHDAIKDDVSGVIDTDGIEVIAELPYHLHVDHREGLDLWPKAGANAVLIIYGAPAPERTDPDQFVVRAGKHPNDDESTWVALVTPPSDLPTVDVYQS